MNTVISVHFAEIALKGKNRAQFETALAENIKVILGRSVERVIRKESRLFVYPNDVDEALRRLRKVFGIAWYSNAELAGREIGEIKEVALKQAEGLKGYSLKVEASRSDKTFGLTSPEINRQVGSALESAGNKIDVKNPDRRIYIQVLANNALVSSERIPGLGGLPVGTSGKVLSLLSGGIDSPVASWLMMKRGCSVDFLHVHASPSSKDIINSKIPKVIQKLRDYHPDKCRLFIAPYSEFYKRSLSINPKAELVVFRRFILRLADRLAEEQGYLGIFTGDNIGQVASQTLENLRATNRATTFPIYRPLLTYDKQEIVNLAKDIGTYDLSVEDYKDCCSLVAMRHPSTKVKPEIAEEIEKEIQIDEVVEKTLGLVETVEI